jgi:integrase
MQAQNKAGWRTIPQDGDGTLLVRRLTDGREVYYGKFSVDGRQVKKALGSNLTERQAKRALAKLVTTCRPRQRVDADQRRTVPEAAEATIFALEDDGTKPSTAYGYRAVARRFSFFGALTVDRVGQRDVERFAQDLLDRGLSPSTRWQTLRLLDATLKFAARRGWAIDPPRVEKPRGRRTQGPVRYLQQRDLECVLDAYADDTLGRVLRALTLTAAWTGLRRGELLGLRWGAVDWDAQKVHVDESYVLGTWDVPKSGRGRSVPLPSRVARELRALRLATPYAGDGDPVFTHPEGTGKPLDASYVSKAFSAALKSAGAPARRFHDLRHSYAVHAAKAGIPLTDLREWLGHADLATTSIYARYCPREGEAERVERAMTA